MTETVEEPEKRDFIVLAGSTMAAIGVGAVVWPFIAQMNPDARSLALASIEVDLEPVQKGQAITVMWRGKPVFIRNRTDEEIKEAASVTLDQLPDEVARSDIHPNEPATDDNRIIKGKENWLVLVGICTHLGCIPKGQSLGDVKGEYGGWFCPCHGSHYDTSGRVRKGPAPRNMQVPPYQFVSDTKIQIG